METNKFDELIEKLNEAKITQFMGDWEENIPDDIWDEYFKNNFNEIKSGLNIDTHRWYETSITVIEIFDRLLGIEHITNMFSDQQEYSDCDVKLRFYEMKPVQTITYEKC